MSFLVTGGSGFVGSAVISHLSNHTSEKFKVLYRDKNCYVSNRIIPIFCDLNNLDTLDLSTFDGVRVIIHCAASAHLSNTSSMGIDIHNVNCKSTLTLATLAAASGVKRFVFVSSIGVNGAFTLNKHFSSNDIPNPHNDYAKSKLNAEIGLQQIASDTGMELVIVRPTLVYGPSAPGNFASLCKLVKYLPLLPFGATLNKRNFISVHNLADLLIICAKHPNAAGHIFLASDANSISTKEFTNAIAVGLNKKILQIPISLSLIRFVAKIIGKSALFEQLFGNLEVDSSNLKEILEWSPPYTMHESMALLNQDNNKSFIND